MLPDLPGLKRDIQRVLDQYLRNRTNQRLDIFGELPKHFMHEGNRMRVMRADGSVDETKLKEAKGQISVNISDVPTLTLEQRIAKLNEVADQIADQAAAHSIKTLTEGLDKAGQVVDHKGKPFDADAVLQVLEKIQIDFDNAGKSDLTILIPPALRTRAEETIRSFKTDKNLQKRHEEIMERKREEWRARGVTFRAGYFSA